MSNVYSFMKAQLTSLFYDWIVRCAATAAKAPVEAYAAYFLAVKARVPFALQEAFPSFEMGMDEFKLFCTVDGVRYRVTNSDREGNVYLCLDFNCSDKHQTIVQYTACKLWSWKHDRIDVPKIESVPREELV